METIQKVRRKGKSIGKMNLRILPPRTQIPEKKKKEIRASDGKKCCDSNGKRLFAIVQRATSFTYGQ